MTQEIELKLSLPRHAAARVWRTRALSTMARSKLVTRRLYAAYYDTPGCDLAKRGAALRLRREGRRWIQTVKGGGPGVSGLYLREETDAAVPAQLVSFPALIEAGLADLVEDAAFRDSLDVVFTADVVRVAAILEPGDGEQIEICLDRGEIAAGERREPLCEIELELRSGHPGRLFELAERLALELPVRVDNMSKAARGYRLAGGLSSGPVRAPVVALPEDIGVDAAFQSLASECLRQLQANERGVLDSADPEYVHQARVAIRRLRSVFTLFGHSVPKTHFADALAWLKDVGSVLGTTRDWDVFCTEMLPRARPRIVAARALTPIAQRAAKLRRSARQRARTVLAAPAYTQRSLALARLLVEGGWQQAREPALAARAALPLRDFVTDLLSRRAAKVRQCGQRTDRDDAASLHALRIETKKLRYACEFFGALFGGKAFTRYLSHLQALQEILGRVNDAATASRLLDILAARRADPSPQRGIEFLLGFAEATAGHQLDGLNEAWRRFERTRPFW